MLSSVKAQQEPEKIRRNIIATFATSLIMSHILVIQNIGNLEILTWKGSVTTHGPENTNDAGESAV